MLVASNLFAQAPGHEWSLRVQSQSDGGECHRYVVTVDPAILEWPELEQAAVIGHEMTHCLHSTSVSFGFWSAPCWPEIDADAGGVQLATAAGYNGREAMTKVLNRLIARGWTDKCERLKHIRSNQ